MFCVFPYCSNERLNSGPPERYHLRYQPEERVEAPGEPVPEQGERLGFHRFGEQAAGRSPERLELLEVEADGCLPLLVFEGNAVRHQRNT
jgi:hypothetical protein